MKSKRFLSLLFFLLLLAVPRYAAAQFIPGEESEGITVNEYRKVKDDSLRVRKSKLEPKRKRKAASDSLNTRKNVAKKSSKGTAVKQPKVRVQKIDSVEYEGEPFRLGDRIIMRGDSGADVKAVARILVNKLYMDEDSIIYMKNGDVLYDGELYRSVKRFQRLNDMHDDGIIGPMLIKALRKRK